MKETLQRWSLWSWIIWPPMVWGVVSTIFLWAPITWLYNPPQTDEVGLWALIGVVNFAVNLGLWAFLERLPD